MCLLNRIYFLAIAAPFYFANLSFFSPASRWLKEESLTPPKPQVHIRGTHQTCRRKDNKTETSTTTDFDLRLSLGEYFIEGNVRGHWPHLRTVDQNKKTNRGGRWKTVATDLEAAKLSVRSWADKYCEDESTLKEYVLLSSMRHASCTLYPRLEI